MFLDEMGLCSQSYLSRENPHKEKIEALGAACVTGNRLLCQTQLRPLQGYRARTVRGKSHKTHDSGIVPFREHHPEDSSVQPTPEGT